MGARDLTIVLLVVVGTIVLLPMVGMSVHSGADVSRGSPIYTDYDV